MVKTNIGKILSTYEENFEAQSKSKESLRALQLLVEKMIQAVRVVIGREVPRQDMSVPTYSTLSSLPPVVATVLAPLYNKPFWTPMFLVVLKQQLGRSVKTLLIDILIIHLFGKIENRKWLTTVQSTLEAATDRLKQFKFRRESGEVRSLGVTLSHVDSNAAAALTNQDEDAEPDDPLISQRTGEGTQSSTASNVATMGSQPLRSTFDPSSQSSRPSEGVETTGGMAVDPPEVVFTTKQTAAFDNRQIPEADLIE